VTTVPLPAQRRRLRLAKKERDVFLEALANAWKVNEAAALAGHHRQRFYEARAADESFAAAWDAAEKEGIEVAENELRRRGIDGYDEMTFDGEDKLIRRVHRYDTPALVAWVKAHDPRYRDNAAAAVVVPTVIVLESAFQGRAPIEAEVVESTARELPEAEA
jgi:hypothetical protein